MAIVFHPKSNEPRLSISAQKATKEVLVDAVKVNEPSFAVIRAIEGNRLSQIIEVSSYLNVGIHTGLIIPLGDFYKGGQELVVMIFKDNGDQIFNDLDQPAIDNKGAMIARYVTSGETVPAEYMQSNPSMGHVMGDMEMFTVRYTDIGFEPTSLEVPLGSMVQFINESNREMWVASNEHPGHELLPTFDEFEAVKKGGSYTYVFDKAGTWPYHDHVNAGIEGVINVTQ
jgi:plastocyanin